MNFKNLFQECLNHYQEIKGHAFVVDNAIPIPFFGDLHSYKNSKLRIVTAALNPSDKEFPIGKPKRFNTYSGVQSPANLEKELCGYFHNDPYTRWFLSFENVLRGLDASYNGKMLLDGEFVPSSTAIHLDLCAPIATTPTWSHLSLNQKRILLNPGKQIFLKTVSILKPQIIIASVGWSHLSDWSGEFRKHKDWYVCKQYDSTKTGSTLQNPLRVWVRQLTFSDTTLWFANASAANTPFGRFSNERKTDSGRAILEHTKLGYDVVN